MPGGLESVFRDGFVLLGAGSTGDGDAKRTEDDMRPVNAEKLVHRRV